MSLGVQVDQAESLIFTTTKTGISRMGYARFSLKDESRKAKAGLRSLLATLWFVSVLLLLFKLLLEFGALLRFEVGALLALDLKLLLGTQQLDERLFSAIALLKSSANNPQIAAVAVAIARSHHVKKPLDSIVCAEKSDRLTASMQIALLAQGDHLLDEGTDGLGLGYGRVHAIFFDNGGHQVAQQRAAMAGVASKFESCIAMAHDEKLSFSER
jgi:hypothetical protein